MRMDSVGAYEAKTHLPRLLDEVAHGKTIIITKHGRAVAQLAPARGASPAPASDVIAALRLFRRGKHLAGDSPSELIEAGRRF